MIPCDQQKSNGAKAVLVGLSHGWMAGRARFRTVAFLAMMLLLAGLYVLAANFVFPAESRHPRISTVWLPTGVALAALIGLGLRLWPGVFLGAFSVEATAVGALPQAAAIAVGDTLEAVVGAWLVRRFADRGRVFDRVQGTLRFVFFCGAVSTMIGAWVGVTTVCWFGEQTCAWYGAMWISWWLGGAVGALVGVPVLVCWSQSPKWRWNRARTLEAGLLLLALFGVSELTFGDGRWSHEHGSVLASLYYPVLVWIALRFGQRETATATALLAGLASWGAWTGTGFLEEDRLTSLICLQAFLAVTAVTALVLASRHGARFGRRGRSHGRTTRSSDGVAGPQPRLSGLLAICAACKKIRNDQGDWEHLEVYLQSRVKVRFTHGMCPDCFEAWRRQHKLTG